VASHGSSNRGLDAGAMPGVAFGRFGKMFDLPPAAKAPDAALEALATAMIKRDVGKPITVAEPVDENPAIPAGYTYFGQFIDHDITFDPTPLGAFDNDVDGLVDFRSPALDLDSMYGRGPDDQPYLYEGGLRLRVGRAMQAADAPVGTRADLFRLQDGGTLPGGFGTPLLGDKRNDENKIVSQVHGAFIAFHNKVVDDQDLIAAFGGDFADPVARFRAAARCVRWHYQWVVVHDYLNRICEPGMVAEVLNAGGTPRLLNYVKQEAPYAYMPVEFSGAAFRFGHSMVRPGYALNFLVGTDPAAAPNRIPTFTKDADPLKNLNGFPGTLPDQWGLDWGYFLDGDLPANAGPGFQVPQKSYRIDANLVSPLQDLPEFRGAMPDIVRNLAFRNLRRGQMLGLPSGQAVATRLGIKPLPDDILWDAGSRLLAEAPPPGDSAADLKTTRDNRAAVRAAWVDGGLKVFERNAPLWYYILREAEHYGVTAQPDDPARAFGGQHLGPVGSRIVAETLIGLLHYDRGSMLHAQPPFKPHAKVTGGRELTLSRIVEFALS